MIRWFMTPYPRLATGPSNSADQLGDCGATGATSIRDVIAFPKSATAQCLLMKAPSEVSDAQLADLHVARAGKALEPPPAPFKPHAHHH